MAHLAFHPPLLAHRGASADAPENTLASIRLAREQGAAWVEFDVKLTHDGVPILMHDDTLERTTDGKGNVADTIWADIQKCDAGSWFNAHFKGEKVPHLADAVRAVLDCGLHLNLEIKPCPGRAKATAMVALIETAKLWPHDRPPPLISSFDEEALATAAQLHPEWPRSLACEEWRENWPNVARRFGASALTIDVNLLTPVRLSQLVQSGLAILPYTVNDAARAKELMAQGVTAVFCDAPGRMVAALK
jgi:glycerophosphoryl diester phosphodiesterase